MDTIETSNLNRQFLFRKRHVGQSKAQVTHTARSTQRSCQLGLTPPWAPTQVARESVLRFRPDAQVVAHFDNVKSKPFDTAFFRRFDIVLNGLDNLDARRHVNRMCLAAEVPLVESGTAGYLGQVSVHIKGVSPCFECEPKAAPKTFPVCTIRNTPDKVRQHGGRCAYLVPGALIHIGTPPPPRAQPIHCIVWAKDMLFATLFGPKEASDLEEQEEEEPAGEGEDDDAKLTRENAQERAERAVFFQRRPDESAVDFGARIFGRAYGTDIDRLVRMAKLWEKPGRKAPTPLPGITPDVATRVAGLVTPDLVSASACSSLGLKDPNALWTVPEAASVFLLSTARLAERQASLGGVPLSFDKDDVLACEMVAAAALLRGANYGIPGQSLFAAKGMAGNIIHAIATTNAIISGLIVLQAVSVLRGQRTGLQNVYLARLPSHSRRKGSRLLMPEACNAPLAGCFVCGRQRMKVALDLTTWTVGALIDKVLIPKFSMQMPVLMGGNNFYFEHSTEGLDDDELADSARVRARTLATAPGGGLKDGDIVQLLDDSSSLKFEIQLVHRTQWDAATEPDGFLVAGEMQAPQAAPAEAAAPPTGTDEEDIIVMDDEVVPQPGTSAKRKREADAGAEQPGPAKKAHAPGDGDDVIVL